jgi:hypothetical protein
MSDYTPGPGKVFRKDLWFQKTGYVPHGGQRLVHYNPARHRVLCNGRRWGKTLVGGKECEAAAFVKNFLGQPQIGWIIGPEYTDCEKEFRVIFDTFKKLGIDRISDRFLNNTENGNMHIKTKWGFDLQCRSARHPESLVGEGLDFVLIVEAGRQRRKMWGDYVRPALSDKRGWSLASGVPEGAAEDSLLYSLYQRGQDPTKKSWWSIRMPSWTNVTVFPGGYNDPEIQEAKDDLTDDEFDRQYGAQFVERVGRVMKEWDSDVHIKKVEYNRALPLYAAVDFGYVNDWVWLLIQIDHWGKISVIYEQRWQMHDTEEIAKELLQNPLTRHVNMIYVDPAAPSDASILRRVLQKNTNNNTGGEILDRVRMIRSALKRRPEHLPDDHPEKQPNLFVDENCQQLIWEMKQGYRWPEHKDPKYGEGKNPGELPLDRDNHGVEALGRFFKGHVQTVSKDLALGASRQARTTKTVGGRR